MLWNMSDLNNDVATARSSAIAGHTTTAPSAPSGNRNAAGKSNVNDQNTGPDTGGVTGQGHNDLQHVAAPSSLPALPAAAAHSRMTMTAARFKNRRKRYLGQHLTRSGMTAPLQWNKYHRQTARHDLNPRVVSSQGFGLYVDAIAGALRAGNMLAPLTDDLLGTTRCSIFLPSEQVLEDGSDSAMAIPMLAETCSSEIDCICIIENIDPQWIAALGSLAGAQIPHAFFIGHASDTTDSAEHRQALSKMTSRVDELAEETWSLHRSLSQLAKSKPQHDASISHASAQNSNFQRVLELVGSLAETLLIMNAVVEGLGVSGEPNGADENMDDLAEFSKLGKECHALLSDLRGFDGNDVTRFDRMKVAISNVADDLENLRQDRSRQYHNIDAIFEFDIPSEDTSSEDTRNVLYKRRDLGQDRSQQYAPQAAARPRMMRSEMKLSYIRAHKHICELIHRCCDLG